MIKGDKKTIEELSFQFDEQEIANLKSLINYLKDGQRLTISDAQADETIKTLDKINKLKLEGKIYAFHIYDTYTEYVGSNGRGVELYLRQGDTLNEYLRTGGRDENSYTVEDAIEFLKDKKVEKIYTVPIMDKFLDLPSMCDKKTPLYRNMLKDIEIEEFAEGGIEVIILDS